MSFTSPFLRVLLFLLICSFAVSHNSLRKLQDPETNVQKVQKFLCKFLDVKLICGKDDGPDDDEGKAKKERNDKDDKLESEEFFLPSDAPSMVPTKKQD